MAIVRACMQVALLEQLLDEAWAGSACLVLNPEWAQQGIIVPQEYASTVSSIAVAYSFLPCAIKVRRKRYCMCPDHRAGGACYQLWEPLPEAPR